jgi:ribosomal-protein-alanine N-acetyltransferase
LYFVLKRSVLPAAPNGAIAIPYTPEGAIRAKSTPAEVAALERACFAEAWPETALRDILANPAAAVWILDDPARRPLGYLLFQEAGSDAEILRIGTVPAQRQRGVGLRLLRVFQAWCRQRGIGRIFLDVREDNGAARRLYERGGFTPAGRRRGYYTHPPGDALVFQWLGGAAPPA